METKVCLLLHFEPSKVEWCKNILSGKNIQIDFCRTMSELHEKAPKKHDLAIIIGEKFHHMIGSEKFSYVGEVTDLLLINKVDFLILHNEKPDSRKILDFLEELREKEKKLKEKTPLFHDQSNIPWPEIESQYHANDYGGWGVNPKVF
ncbi:MAG: hypothetical protein WCO07_00140 [bacterium]